MPSEAAVIQSLETYELYADVYTTLASFSKLASFVRRKSNVLILVFHFRKANSAFKNMFEKVHEAMEGKGSGTLSDEPVSEIRLRETSDNLMHLYRTMDYIYEGSRRAGLLNNSLTSSQLIRMQKYSEGLLDLVDWLGLVAQKEDVRAIFERSRRETENGETFDLELVQ